MKFSLLWALAEWERSIGRTILASTAWSPARFCPAIFPTTSKPGSASIAKPEPWLAYSSDETGRFEVYVTPFPGTGGKWQVSNGGRGSPHWTADGRQLYYVAGDKVMIVPIQNVETFEFGAPIALPIHGNEFAALGPPAPGERFPALKALSGVQAPPQEVILNWKGTLRQ